MMKRSVPVDENDLGEIPPTSFYGSLDRRKDLSSKRTRWESQLEKLEKVEAEFKSKPLTQSYKPRLNDPCILRQTFFKQKDAFAYVRDTCDVLHVFSFESPRAAIPNTGRRQYLVCSYVQFYHYYRQLRHKHHYEVIPEGEPCHLYFDLEYAIENNPEGDGDSMVEALIKIVNHKLHDLYGIRCDRRMIVDLSATTETKFSRHLVYHLPRAVFTDNIQAGNFVNHVCTEIMGVLARATEEGAVERLGTCLEDVRSLIVKKKDGGETLFCDLAVYTKNRNFRLLNSTKRGRRNPLVVANQCRFRGRTGTDGNTCPQQLFLDSLISNVSITDETRVLTCDDGCRLQYRRSSPRGTAPPSGSPPLDGAGSSPYPDIDDFIRGKIQDDGGHGKIQDGGGHAKIQDGGGHGKIQDDGGHGKIQDGGGHGKIQDGGSHVKIQDGGGSHVTGGIRRWSYFGDCELILYEIHTNRFCENVGRHHRSNNIMLLVDLRRGVYYQKCHDPECQRVNFKSQDYPVPDELLPKHYLDYSLESDFSDQSDSERPMSEEESHATEKSERPMSREESRADDNNSERQVARPQSDERSHSDNNSERQVARPQSDERSRHSDNTTSERPNDDDDFLFDNDLDVTDDDLRRVVENAECAKQPTTSKTKPEMELTEPEMELTEPEMELTEPKMELTEPKMELTEPEMELTEPEMELTDVELLAAVGKLEESFS